MRQVELNPKGDYTHWECEKLEELLQDRYPDELGTLMAETEHFRLWNLELLPMERLSFRKQPSNYGWTCTTGGTVTFTNGNGRIDLVFFERGDHGFINNADKHVVTDIKNIGPRALRLQIQEYKSPICFN
ncbi:hypothetical protein [Maribacter sp. 2307ULW6-5]|uniref:hypothetical protein n=1 Tax=Maribacter sp. 2307ULW6-5 TaxID=3386275 RepID=UPI0039BCAF62